MEGDGHFTFRKSPRVGCCPVSRCRRKSRSARTGETICSDHRLCNTHKSQLWRKVNREKAAYIRLKYHAKERHKVFEITFEFFMSITRMQEYVDYKGKRKHMLTLDRRDPLLGYVEGNIRVITNAENVAKQHDDRRKALSGYVPPETDAPTPPEDDPF